MDTRLDITKTVKKSNILNEMRNANATMAEYRLFCVYLAHLPMSSDDNRVTFSLAEYARIAGLDRPRYADIKTQAENIVGTTATLPNDDGGFTVYSLFSDFKLHQEDEQWMVTLECNPKIGPMIREQRGRFLRYKLYNTIYLKSYNQQRIYEILKQYEKIGVRTETLENLREFLSIGKDEYPVWGVFARDVLKVAQKAIKESTDISFEYEPVKKGKKVVAVKFTIKKNDGFKDLLQLDSALPGGDFEYEGGDIEVSAAREDPDVDPNQLTIFDDVESKRKKFKDKDLEFLAEACDFEFTEPEMENLKRIMVSLDLHDEEFDRYGIQMVRYHYLADKYSELNVQAQHTQINNRFAYFRKIVEAGR